MDAAADDACYVYFLRQRDGGNRIKIGMSSSPQARLEQLQTGNPQKIAIEHTTRFATRRAARACEHALHDRYRRHRVNREWFALDDDQLRDAIQRSVAMSGESNNVGDPASAAAAANSPSFWWSSLLPSGLLAAAPGNDQQQRRRRTLIIVVVSVTALIAIALIAWLVASSSARRCVGAWCRANADRVVNRALDTAFDGVKQQRRR